MAVITFANPKGGSGKTTSAMLLAEQLVAASATVAVLDCDPNQNIVQWAQARTRAGREVPFMVEALPEETEFIDAVERLSEQADYVVIDLEGTASQLVTYATSQSDLVLIPFEPTPMEARQAARAIQLVRNTGKMMNRQIDHALLLTRVNAAFQTSEEKDVRKETYASDVPVLKTALVRRAAYTRIFKEGMLLSEILADTKEEMKERTKSQQERVLKPLRNAVRNAKMFAQEVVNTLHHVEAAA